MKELCTAIALEALFQKWQTLVRNKYGNHVWEGDRRRFFAMGNDLVSTD